VGDSSILALLILIISVRQTTRREQAFMKKMNSTNGVRTEYDFASMKGGVRGKYAKRYLEGANIVLLEPDIAEAFPNHKAVNQALRGA
jgi:hypothetical protein